MKQTADLYSCRRELANPTFFFSVHVSTGLGQSGLINERPRLPNFSPGSDVENSGCSFVVSFSFVKVTSEFVTYLRRLDDYAKSKIRI